MSHEWTKFSGNQFRVETTFASVAANTSSARQEINIGHVGGNIVSLSIHTANVVLYDFRIFQHASALAGTIHEIIRVIDITQFYHKGNEFDVHFANRGDPQVAKIYFEIDNRSLVAPTGTITLQMFIHSPGSGA